MPPLFGATNATEIDALPRVTVGWAGASGSVAGTADAEAIEGEPSPSALVAKTVHVYVLPLVRPVTTIGDVPPPLVPKTPPLLDVHAAVKPVIVLPLLAGATKVTEICVLPAETVGWAGAAGTAAGTTGAEAGDSRLFPTALVAWTVQV